MLFAVILDPDFRPQRVQILGTTALLSSCLVLICLCFELILTEIILAITPFFSLFNSKSLFEMGSSSLCGSST